MIKGEYKVVELLFFCMEKIGIKWPVLRSKYVGQNIQSSADWNKEILLARQGPSCYAVLQICMEGGDRKGGEERVKEEKIQILHLLQTPFQRFQKIVWRVEDIKSSLPVTSFSIFIKVKEQNYICSYSHLSLQYQGQEHTLSSHPFQERT